MEEPVSENAFFAILSRDRVRNLSQATHRSYAPLCSRLRRTLESSLNEVRSPPLYALRELRFLP